MIPSGTIKKQWDEYSSYSINKVFYLILSIGLILLLLSCSKGDKNYDNCLDVQLGMNQKEVKQIMGEPKNTRISPGFPKYKHKVHIYSYSAPVLASDGIYIIFDIKTKKVIGVICSESERDKKWTE